MALDSAGTHFFVTRDRLGSVRALISRFNPNEWKLGQAFDPYGLLIQRDSAADGGVPKPPRYQWTGREYDPETGWYYLRARYYSPADRRFVQEDPAGFGGGDNLYAYVGGAVLEARDPSGLLSPYGTAGRDDGMWWDPHACGECEPAGVGLPEKWDNFAWNDAATPAAIPPPPDLSDLDAQEIGAGAANSAADCCDDLVSVGEAALGALAIGLVVVYGPEFLPSALDMLSGVAAATAGSELMSPEQQELIEPILAVAKDGTLVNTANIAGSHMDLLERTFGTRELPVGAWIGTFGKFGGNLTALNSRSIMGNQGAAPEWVQTLMRTQFR